jgi:hypothetical protein
VYTECLCRMSVQCIQSVYTEFRECIQSVSAGCLYSVYSVCMQDVYAECLYRDLLSTTNAIEPFSNRCAIFETLNTFNTA